jgi:hypothetical protein
MNVRRIVPLQLLVALSFLSNQAAARQSPLRFAGQDCELAITELSANALRLTLTSKGDAAGTSNVDSGPVLIRRTWPEPLLKVIDPPHEKTVALKLEIVTTKPSPLTQ